MYYPCSENKGADQLRGYREADLRLCFRICKKPVFSCRGSYDNFFSFKEPNESNCLHVQVQDNTDSDLYSKFEIACKFIGKLQLGCAEAKKNKQEFLRPLF